MKNDFFGETVTCTGLLTGRDIVKAVEDFQSNGGSFDELVLDGNTMKEFEEIFLCGMTTDELAEKLNCEIKIVDTDGFSFVDAIFDN